MTPFEVMPVMFASFALLVHGPMLQADPSSLMNWSENGLNHAVLGAAWVVADPLCVPRPDDARFRVTS